MNMKQRVISLLCAALVPGILLPTALVRAADDTGNSTNGVVLSKTISEPAADGSYTLTLEAYVTGQKVITEVKEDIPTDIVLVLDQSGSMGNNNITNYGFEAYTSGTTNETYYEYRHNGGDENLWYQLEDGSYVSVSMVRTATETGNYTYTRYYDSGNNRNYRGSNIYEMARNQTLYYLHNGEYHPMAVTREWIGSGWDGYYRYTYRCTECDEVITYTDDYARPNNTYQFYTRQLEYAYTYTYSYTLNGVTTVIGTSAGADNAPTDFTLYERVVVSSVSRLAALKTALTTFAGQVETKAKGVDGIPGTEDDVDHNIAVVGFARGTTGNHHYLNTEVFIGANQYEYGTAAREQYGNAFQDMSTPEGVANVTASIGALAAEGATRIDLGLEMANGILTHADNAIPTGEKRNRVVIVFADGVPSTSSNYSEDVADDAYDNADTIKNSGIPVYAVGVFSGADATSTGSVGNNASNAAIGNYVLQHISSNNGTPQSPSYYLSAGDAGTLNNIFRQLSDQIESGGASSTLTETTVVQDIISDEFTLPAGADASSIMVYTAPCTGKSGDTPTFGNRTAFSDATVTITENEDGTGISVSNFNYSENWVGTETAADNTVTYRGNKLIIEIPIVVRPDFLGGNQVATNGEASGIYVPGEDGSLKNVAYFAVPKVDLPLKEVSQPTADQHLYVGTAADIGRLVTEVGDFTVDGVEYTVDGVNNGYVDLTYTMYDSSHNVVGTFTIPAGTASGTVQDINWVTPEGVDMSPVLTDDVTTYYASCTVTANPTGAYSAKTSPLVPASVYIYKPCLTFADSVVDFGAATPDEVYYNSTNYKNTVWKCGDKTATASMGTAPALTLTYTDTFGPSPTVTVKEDVPVVVSVAVGDMDITAYTTFLHEDCPHAGCIFDPNKEQFVVHVRLAELTIIKAYDGMDLNQSAVFTVTTSSGYHTTVIIPDGAGSATITGLKVGDTVTITENKGWVWRYSVQNTRGSGITAEYALDKDPANNKVTFTNTRAITKWLSGENFAVNKGGSGIAVTRGEGGPVEPTTPPVGG